MHHSAGVHQSVRRGRNRPGVAALPSQQIAGRRPEMLRSIIFLVGLVVVVLAIVNFVL
jgi:hypothetical protein